MHPGLLLLAPFILVLGGDSGAGYQRPILGRDTRITAAPVLLDPAHPGRTRLGPLRYLGGWVLDSPDPAFGSFSAMAIERGSLILVSDAGNVVRLAVDKTGVIRGVSFGDLPGGPGDGSQKQDRDSESMAIDPATGQLWIGFENANAIARYTPDFGRMERLARPREMRGWPGGGGPEAMVRLKSGRFLVFSEAAPYGAALAFEGDPTNPATKRFRFSYRPPAGYRVTEATQLPDGRLMLLHRRVSLPDYFAAKLAILDPATIRAGARVKGREIATMVRPMTVDNMEAMAATEEDGRTILWIASDHNFKGPFQRTLLMKFALEE